MYGSAWNYERHGEGARLIPVDQTITGARGNCYSACLASLFELPIELTPYGFDENYDGTTDSFWEPIYQWLADKGYGLFHLTVKNDFDISWYPGYLIAVGHMPGSSAYHAVIYYNGLLHHDPSPMKAGLEKVEQVDLLYPLDPSRLTYKP